MRGKNRKSIASFLKLPQFTTTNVIDGQAGLICYSSLIFYSLTIDNILNVIVLLILAGVTINAIVGNDSTMEKAKQAKTKSEAADELDTIKLAVVDAVAQGSDGLVHKTQLDAALIKIGIGASEEKTDENGKTVFDITGNKGNYRVSLNGEVKSTTGITLDQSTITFTEGQANGNVTLTAKLSADLAGQTVNWESNNENIATVSNGVVSVASSPSGNSNKATITAKVAKDTEEYTASCTVTYVETILTGIAITSPVLTNEKYTLGLSTTGANATGEIEVEGRGRVGGTIALTSSDLSKISATATNGATYVQVGDVTLSGTKAKIPLTGKGETAENTPENVTVKYNTSITVGTVEVTVEGPSTPAVGNYIDLGVNVVGTEATTDDWKILYDGTDSDDATLNGKIYCILADYLPNTNSVIAAELNPVSGTTYNVNSTSQKALINSLKSETAWLPLVSETIRTKYPTIKVYGALTGNGSNGVMDKIKTASGTSTYYKASSVANYDTHGCYGYWLASPNSVNNVYSVNNSGLVRYNCYSYNSEKCGVCPVVILPSSVSLTKTNGVWHVN